jgi:hypothetical protein
MILNCGQLCVTTSERDEANKLLELGVDVETESYFVPFCMDISDALFIRGYKEENGDYDGCTLIVFDNEDGSWTIDIPYVIMEMLFMFKKENIYVEYEDELIFAYTTSFENGVLTLKPVTLIDEAEDTDKTDVGEQSISGSPIQDKGV